MLASNEHFTMDLPLPIEIFLEIFSRLHLKPLIRCKSVSKTWHFLICHPLLPKMRSTKLLSEFHPTCLVLHSLPSIKDRNTNLYLLPFNPPSSVRESPIKLNLPFQSTQIIDVCSSNGLLCLIFDSQEIFIYNPSTLDYFQIPNSGPGLWASGFGFDPNGGKYKVVQVFSYRDSNEKYLFTINVYTIGDDLTWRCCRDADGKYFFYRDGAGVYVNGAIHWLVHTEDEILNRRRRLVFYFSLGTEESGVFPFPYLSNCLEGHTSLMAFGGYLSVVYKMTHADGNGVSTAIWVMKEYGVNESWVQEYVINDFPTRLDVFMDDDYIWVCDMYDWELLCFNGNGEFVLCYGQRRLVAYDPLRGIYRNLELQTGMHIINAVPHLDTIIPGAVTLE